MIFTFKMIQKLPKYLKNLNVNIIVVIEIKQSARMSQTVIIIFYTIIIQTNVLIIIYFFFRRIFQLKTNVKYFDILIC